MSTKRPRRHFTTEQKAEILRRHLVDKLPVSELCNELGLQPSVFYQWQRQVHENLAGALTAPAAAGPSRRDRSTRTWPVRSLRQRRPVRAGARRSSPPGSHSSRPSWPRRTR